MGVVLPREGFVNGVAGTTGLLAVALIPTLAATTFLSAPTTFPRHSTSCEKYGSLVLSALVAFPKRPYHADDKYKDRTANAPGEGAYV